MPRLNSDRQEESKLRRLLILLNAADCGKLYPQYTPYSTYLNMYMSEQGLPERKKITLKSTMSKELMSNKNRIVRKKITRKRKEEVVMKRFQ